MCFTVKYVSNSNNLWPLLQFQFHERIAQLTYTFPEDATTSTGSLFWSAPKRFPQPLTFDPADPSHVAFAQAGAILKAQVHNIEVPAWADDFSKVVIICQFAGLHLTDDAPASVLLGHGTIVELANSMSIHVWRTLHVALAQAVLLFTCATQSCWLISKPLFVAV